MLNIYHDMAENYIEIFFRNFHIFFISVKCSFDQDWFGAGREGGGERGLDVTVHLRPGMETYEL